MNARAGESFTWAPIETGFAGLVGTLKVGIYDGDTAVSALTAAGVNEISSSGVYEAAMTAPANGGRYVLIASLDGTLSPDQVVTEDLVVSTSFTSTDLADDAFASTADLEARLGVTFTSGEATRAETLLAFAAGLIRDAVKQKISLVEDDALTLVGTNADRITLPERPVVSVASATLDDHELGFTLDENTIRRSSGGWFDPDCWSAGFGRRNQTLVITYTHGYSDDDLPALVRQINIEAAARVWDNPGGLIAERVGDTEVTFSSYNQPPQGLLLTDNERRQLQRFFGNRGVTVMVG